MCGVCRDLKSGRMIRRKKKRKTQRASLTECFVMFFQFGEDHFRETISTTTAAALKNLVKRGRF